MSVDVEQVCAGFRAAFPGGDAPRVCRAPGRINLIGEHTDYNGLPVLPMTVDRDIVLAFRERPDGMIHLRNTDSAFPEVSFANAATLTPSAPGSWDNYCKAAVAALNRAFGCDPRRGMDVLVASYLPVAAGLASSSALVVACALAYLAVQDRDLDGNGDRLRLAELLADAEHFVGTRGGGMDQAVILCGQADHACKIDFHPLRIEPAPLLPNHVVVVCDSTVKAEKGGAARNRYNAGPRLCGVIRALVEKQLQEEIDEDVALERLGDLFHGALCLTVREARALCANAVPEPRVSLAAVAKRLGLRPDEARARWLDDLPEPPEGFPLQAMLRHQLTEYERVERARDALLAEDAEELGRLMNASHESCARDYGVSCPELDRLVDIARKAGALGARLTGAGFGGATVNLVPADRVERFMDAVAREYYRGFPKRQGPPPMFVARAVNGAGMGTIPRPAGA